MNPPDDYAYTLQLLGTSEMLKLAEEWLRTHSIAGDDEPIIPGFFSETADIEKNGLIVGRAFTLEWGSIPEEPELKQTIDQLATAFPQMQIDLVEENVDHAEKSEQHRWINGQCESRYATLIMPSFGARGEKSSDPTRMAITRNVNGQLTAFELTPDEMSKAWNIVSLNACRDRVLEELRAHLQDGEFIAGNSPLLNEWADDLWEAEKKSAEYFSSDDLGFIVDLEKARQQGLLQKRELAPERMSDQLAAAQEQAKATINTPSETVNRDIR